MRNFVLATARLKLPEIGVAMQQLGFWQRSIRMGGTTRKHKPYQQGSRVTAPATATIQPTSDVTASYWCTKPLT
jgi:hypothetical protein